MPAVQPEHTGMLTEDMKRVVREQRLGFVATVCPDGTPNLSPKGTTNVWDDDHLVFCDLNSPQTVANLRTKPAIEVNVVDPIARKGYRFKGSAEVLSEGALFEDILAFYQGGDPPHCSCEDRKGPPARLAGLRSRFDRERDQELLVGALQLAPKPTPRRCQLIEMDCCSTLFLPDDGWERRHP